jgi:vacuolar-type H+-ATPase subunit I/STV1
MAQTSRSDAERLKAIQQLEGEIQAKQPALQSARSERDEARRVETERRNALSKVDSQIRALNDERHLTGTGVYLNGASLDRGTLAIGNDLLVFSGWHGKVEIPLHAIVDIDTGRSFLPPRAGIPILSTVWPGQPRQAETLLLTVQEEKTKGRCLAVVANLPDAATWSRQIRQQQRGLDAVRARRAELIKQNEEARATLNQATWTRQQADAKVSAIASEIRGMQSRQRQLETEQRQVEAARALAARERRQATRRRTRR